MMVNAKKLAKAVIAFNGELAGREFNYSLLYLPEQELEDDVLIDYLLRAITDIATDYREEITQYSREVSMLYSAMLYAIRCIKAGQITLENMYKLGEE